MCVMYAGQWREKYIQCRLLLCSQSIAIVHASAMCPCVPAHAMRPCVRASVRPCVTQLSAQGCCHLHKIKNTSPIRASHKKVFPPSSTSLLYSYPPIEGPVLALRVVLRATTDDAQVI